MTWQELVKKTRLATDQHLIEWKIQPLGRYLAEFANGTWIIAGPRSFTYGSNVMKWEETFHEDDQIMELYVSIQNPQYCVRDALSGALDHVLQGD